MPEDYDSPWKTALTRYFQEFLLYYFPDIHAAVDWSVTPVFLDKELLELTADARPSRCLADQLVQIRTLGERSVLLHIEIQVFHDARLPARIFKYNYRIHERFRPPVASLAVLPDTRPSWRPTLYASFAFGCATTCSKPAGSLIGAQLGRATRVRPILDYRFTHATARQSRTRDLAQDS